MKKVSLLSLVIALFQSCTLLPCDSDEGLSKAPKTVRPDDLIGKYKPDEFSLDDYPALWSSGSSIELHPGWLEFKKLPLGIFDIHRYDDGSQRLVSGTARWGIAPFGNNIFSVIISYDDTELPGVSTEYRLYRKDLKYVILIPIGDPDECRAVRFVQQ